MGGVVGFALGGLAEQEVGRGGRNCVHGPVYTLSEVRRGCTRAGEVC